MDVDLAALPDDVETLQRIVRALAAERTRLSEAQAEIERLRLIVQKLQRSQFGQRAERLDDDQLQLGFEDLNADIAGVEATIPATAKTSICPARTRGSILSIRPAPAVVASCMRSARRSAGCSTMYLPGFALSAFAGRVMAAGPAGPSIRLPPRSVR